MALADQWPLVQQLAPEYGIDPHLGLAMVFVESTGNPRAVGDGACSKGLLQMNQCGGLGTGYSDEQLYDPETNLRLGFDHLARTALRGTPGEWAARSQRPFDPADYARKVDAALVWIREQFPLGDVPVVTPPDDGTGTLPSFLPTLTAAAPYLAAALAFLGLYLLLRRPATPSDNSPG